MGKGWKDFDDTQDSSYWNSRLKREFVKYEEAAKAYKTEEQRESILNVLELFNESCDYELDTVILNDAEYAMAKHIKGILTEQIKRNYTGSQDEWRKKLEEALEEGDIFDVIELTKIGLDRSFIRKPGSQHEEYYNEVKKTVRNIVRYNQRDDER